MHTAKKPATAGLLRLSISLEAFAMLQSKVGALSKTGWFPDDFSNCLTISLADFDTLLDLLEHPIQVVDYIQKRNEMMDKVDLEGCELDIMGLYLKNFLNFGDLPTSMVGNQFTISGMSSDIDKYYMNLEQGVVIEKPRPPTSLLFQEIFKTLEERATPRWSEIGCLLNRFPSNKQQELSQFIVRQSRVVEKNWNVEGHKNTVVFVPPDHSEYALCYVLYKNCNSDRRDEFIANASEEGLAPGHVKYCLVVAKNIDQDDLPYHFIGLFGSVVVK